MAHGRPVLADGAQAEDPSPPSEAQRALTTGLQHARARRWSEARATLIAGLEHEPANAEILYVLGQVQEQLGDQDAAESAYRAAVAEVADWADPWLNLGRLLVQASRFEAAIDPLQHAVELSPDDARAHSLLGVAHWNLEHVTEAIEVLGRAVELDPENGELALDLAIAQRRIGDEDRAVDSARRAARLLPDNPTAVSLLAELLGESNEFDILIDAPATFRQAIGLRPDSAKLYFGLAAAYGKLGVRDEAETALRRAVALQPDNPRFHFELGQMLVQEGRFSDAIASFDRCLALDPDAGWVQLSRGTALYTLRRAEEALAAFDQAIEALPEEGAPFLAAADAAAFLGDLEASGRYLDRAVAAGHDTPLVGLARGRLQLQQGRAAEAVQLLQRVHRSAPELLEAQYLLGQALIKTGQIERGEEILSDYRRRQGEVRQQENESLRSSQDGLGNTGAVYLVRGRVLMTEGRYDAAVQEFEAAAELMPDFPEVWQRLAEAHRAAGNSAAAAAARARYEALEPAPESSR